MSHLPHDTILEIVRQAIAAGLHAKRALMLFGMNIEYVASLDQAGNPSDQLLSDLSAMNNVGPIIGGVIPLERWLRNAAFATSVQPDKQKFFRELADEVAKQALVETAAKTEGIARTPREIRERILFVSELLPFGFLAGAVRTGSSVARLTVPRFEGGQPRIHPFSAEQIKYYGTGWLIGASHVITNHHVINARGEGEADAELSDLELQARSVEVQFDYDQDNVLGTKFTPVGLPVVNRQLDYAILKLPEATGRPPLPLWGKSIELTGGASLPVNIIQHPGGQPKQMAIRNNLAAALQGDDLAYYTDTEGGSSGSPVCSDQWRVLALHKASTMAMGKFTYQGKETAWVNIGTQISRIIADLRANHAELWTQIGANVI